MKASPVVHFEMPSKDKKRVANSKNVTYKRKIFKGK